MAARRKPFEEYATKEDVRAVGIAVERVEAHVIALAEGLTAVRDELKADLAGFEQRLSARILAVERLLASE
jgi:hypothetical protein